MLYLLKIESLHRLFFENLITKSLIDAAPGLKELAILGKITSGPPRYVGPKLNYDFLVVDAFSSGHFFALLKAPMGMAETFRFGPMADQSRGIMKTINNPKLTQIHIVTLPEELPYQETLEVIQQLDSVTSIKPQVWLNKWVNYPDLKQQLGDHQKLAESFQKLDDQQNEYLRGLNQKASGANKIPFFYELRTIPLVNQIATEIKHV